MIKMPTALLVSNTLTDLKTKGFKNFFIKEDGENFAILGLNNKDEQSCFGWKIKEKDKSLMRKICQKVIKRLN